MIRRIKQGIKSIVAVGTAILMTFMPVNGMMLNPVTVFADDTYTLTVTYDDTINKDTITLLDSSNQSVSADQSDEHQVVYNNLSGSYTLSASPSDDYNTDYEVENISISGAGEVKLSAVTKADVNFSININHASITGVQVGAVDVTAAYKIPKGTSPTEKITISYKMEDGYTAPAEWGNGTYETNVKALLSDSGKSVDLTGAVMVAPEGTITISGNPASFNGFYATTASVTASLALENNVPSGAFVEYGTSTDKNTEPTTWTNASCTDKSYTASLGWTSGDSSINYVWFRFSDGSVGTTPIGPMEVKFDTVEPVVERVSFENVVKGMNNQLWINNKNQSSVKILITANDAESGLDIAKYCWSDTETGFDEATAETVSVENGSYSIPYTNSNQRNYFVYRVYDKCGNYEGGFLPLADMKLDLTAPETTISYKKGTDTLNEADLAKWQTEDVTVTIEVKDQTGTSPGEEMSGIPSSGAVVIEDNGTVIPITPVAGAADTYSVTLSNGAHTLSVIAKDIAGNEWKNEQPILIYVDKLGITKPKITCNESETLNSFSGNFTVEASAESISGICRVDFAFHDNLTDSDVIRTVTASNNKVVCPFPTDVFAEEFEGTVQPVFYDNAGNHMVYSLAKNLSYNKNGASIHLSASNKWTNATVPVTVVISDRATAFQKIEFLVNGTVVKTITGFEDIHNYMGVIEVADNAPSSEGTRVTVNVTSTAGFVATDYIYVYIDKQAPAISLGGVTEGGVYNANRTLQITTVENIWQEMKPLRITATKTLDGVTTGIDFGAYEVTDVTSAMGRTFTEDGVYQVTVTAVDAAGNSDTKTISFTIDKTAPALSMTGASEGTYSSRPITINFQAVESFFETNNVRINVERKIEGSTYGRTIHFTNTDKISTLSNTFAEDGDYTITMTATDGAGNVAATQTLMFTVDCTAPAITLSGTKDYFVTSKSVALNFSVVESYYETNEVQIQGNRRLANGKTETVNITGWSNSGRTSALNQEFTEDGYYTIIITATDKAGNNKQQMIHFTIDTEPPVIGDLSQYDGKYLSEFQLKESLDDLISELSVPTVKMTLNGEAYDGSEITQDGKYTLVIEVVDEVGLTASKSIEFVIDRTAPKIIFAGAENKKTYTEVVNLNLSLENENDRIVEILINGEAYELTEGKSAYDLTFDTYGDYEIVVNTIDEAGNENSQTITFTYAEHRNMVFLWILIAAIVGAGGLVVFLVIKTGKKKEGSV